VAADDSSTLTLGPLETLTGSGRGLPVIPTLTIIWHPDVTRIGQMAPLVALLDDELAVVQRDGPIFFPPGSDAGQPLNHRGMSREPAIVVASTRKAFELRRGPATVEVDLDGAPFEGSRPLLYDDLRRGIILTIARRFVFCLHAVRVPVTRQPNLGLLGASDAIEDVRRSITRVADLPTSVLIRGESGTGKELVARAIHQTSRRAGGPFIEVNMAGVRPERATAELFGYERGAFTGATDSRPGFFRAAHGGTLFLDEIGFTPPDVQPMLLRVLEDHKVHALGAAQPRQLDVRVVAATDARLEDAVTTGRFEGSLYHRLNSSFNIALPPLRERRQDIGLLLLHFLRSALAETGELDRLQEPAPSTRSWLTARIVALIARASWPGNFRALKGLAHELAVKATGNPAFEAKPIVLAFLERQPGVAEPETTVQQSAPLPARRADEISRASLLDALEAAGWNQTRAAQALQISRAAFWRRVEREPDIAQLTKLRIADLIRQEEECGGDLTALAAVVGVDPGLLARRLRRSG